MKKVLLYSGGMDSWLIDKLWKPDVKLFFDIGTPNNLKEKAMLLNRDEENINIVKLPLEQFEQRDNNFFLPLRNLHFVVYASHYGDTICLGATGSSTHKDKNETFGTLSENVINYLLSEDTTRETAVKVVMPYKDTTKTELLAEYIRQGGDIEKCYRETFSCYSPTFDGSACLQCTSCQSKFTAFYNNGYHFTDEEIDRFVEGVFNNPHVKGDPLKLAQRISGEFKNTIAVDFDNTLTKRSQYPITGEFNEKCIPYLQELAKEGNKLVLYTSRTGPELEEAINICKSHNLPFSHYVGGKMLAKTYLDDRNMLVPWEE